MLVALDTNILLRIVNPADPQRLEIRRALENLRKRQSSFCFFHQNAAEFWNVCTRPSTSRGGYGLSGQETAKRLALLERFCSVLDEIPGTYQKWNELVATREVKGVQVHDARIVASMLMQHVRLLVTYDVEDFNRYAEIEARSPKELLNR